MERYLVCGCLCSKSKMLPGVHIQTTAIYLPLILVGILVETFRTGLHCYIQHNGTQLFHKALHADDPLICCFENA